MIPYAKSQKLGILIRTFSVLLDLLLLLEALLHLLPAAEAAQDGTV